MAGGFVQCIELYRLCGDALAKIRILGKADHRMFEAGGIKRVKKINHAVFHSPGIEMVDDMHDQRGMNVPCTHCPAT